MNFEFFSIFRRFWRSKTWQHWEGKIASWYMAWFHIKYIKRKSKVSSSNNCNKIFGLRYLERQTKVTQRSTAFLKRFQRVSAVGGDPLDQKTLQKGLKRRETTKSTTRIQGKAVLFTEH